MFCKLKVEMLKTENGNPDEIIERFRHRRSQDCMDLVRCSGQQADELFGLFLKALSLRSWATPARFMFGRVSMRAEWPIQKKGNSRKIS